MPSSARSLAARWIFGWSPSARTTRLGSRLRLLVDDLHEGARRREHPGQAVAVGLEVGDRPPRDAALRGGLGHGGRHAQEHAVVEGLRDQVLAAEAEALDAVGAGDRVRHVLLGEVGEGAGGRELHRLVDLAGAAVERAPEDEREAEDVVHLVRVVGAAGRHDDVGPRGVRLLGQDLGHRVRHREDDRVARHALEHLARDEPGRRRRRRRRRRPSGPRRACAASSCGRSAPCRGSCSPCGPRR